jgi:glycosyltransferase involved in cell wall biosynthesis
VITVHEPYADELVRHGVDPRKVTVVMNSPDNRLFDGLVNGGPRGTRSAFTVAYHGTITSWYGLLLLMRALSMLPGDRQWWRALVLGEGDALDEAMALAEELGVAQRIEFSGRYLPIRDTLARIMTADCGVVPNLSLGLNRFALSSKLLEYVALGVPAVVARLETLALHFNDDEVTFFEPGDAQSLASAIQWVAQYPDEARAKAERARVRLEDYSWPIQSRRYLDLLDGVRAAASPPCHAGRPGDAASHSWAGTGATSSG